jgi:hypothetical protein
MAFTCSSSDDAGPCPPVGDSRSANILAEAQSRAEFDVLYPCTLPAGQSLDSMSVTGTPGRQQVELVFTGPFDMRLRQSQFAPIVNPAAANSSRVDIDLLPNVRALLIETYEGTGDAIYHLLWEQGDIHYEIQAVGPPVQRRAILLAATSLQ